ncbi:YndJ family protein [Priestia abyssalis]|uniref:YndJ family protein n=1 Tax=Priestia abyssalis TaxID=1221450 RepID=UPI000994CB4C|nr:YndJ family protein [Priestia abyssalis]
MKRNVVIGIIFYLFYLIIGWSQLHIVEALVLLSVLVFVPLILMMIDKNMRDGAIMPVARFISRLYPYAALGAMLTFLTDMAVFAAVWFIYTGLIALFGVKRLLERGTKPLGELSIDSGLIYLSLGGFWFFAYAADMQVMHFTKITILLTAIHFHYSAFIIPILVGFLGRKALSNRNGYTAMTLVVVLSPLTVAIGITYSRVIEFLAVLIYVAALYAYGFFIFRTDFRKKAAKILLSFSAAILLVTIFFSFIYAYGRVQESVTLTISEMIFIHGVVNAFGVVLPALLGWLIEGPNCPAHSYYGKPLSRVFGTRTIGSDFLSQKQLIDDKVYTGLIERMKDFSSSEFDVNRLSPGIADFYEQTENYELEANIRWSSWFKPLALAYQHISRRIGQIHLGMGGMLERMDAEIIGVRSEMDGRSDVRAWVRKNEDGETIFAALYSQHQYENETYMNIALPLPYSNMTGILKPYNDRNHLILTSILRKQGAGDEGIYLHTPLFTIRLPLSETFFIKEEEGLLTAHHQMWIFGKKFLEIDYNIKKRME